MYQQDLSSVMLYYLLLLDNGNILQLLVTVKSNTLFLQINFSLNVKTIVCSDDNDV